MINTFFDITGEDIEKLNDTDLRILIGLLCEAEVFKATHTYKGVYYGGHQDVADGGIDVEVNAIFRDNNTGFIPRNHVGFQVKKPPMTPSAIKNEMKPPSKGTVREAIIELANQKGAYIIVSSSTNATKIQLKKRLDAMKEVAGEILGGTDLHLDFYDQNQIASWLREYPALQLWVNNKIDKLSMSAWFPYGNWSHNPYESATDEYILADDVRIFSAGSSSTDKGMSVLESIQDIRKRLDHKGTSIRFVGLSGVGKTRFVEALFDDNIEGNQLNKANVIYTDMGRTPFPLPLHLIHQIRNSDRPIYLIVDNCSRETHRELSIVCKDSEIRLLTIEYDVKDDLPPETDCFRMEPSSVQVIEKIIARRYPNISETDVCTIAGFSEGNARIALALADTMGTDDRLGDLRDEELFQRLFLQRNPHDKDLLKVAKVCALIYSFDYTFDDAADNEINILSQLAEITPLSFRSNVAEIERRKLIQSRSNWKALLPHALANKLAVEALQEYPPEILLAAFRKSKNKRLLLSFAHRISYLHNIQAVTGVVRSWLDCGELSGGLSPYSKLREDLLRYSAPVCPSAVLSMIEQALPNDELASRYFDYLYELLRQIGYEAQYFVRVVEVLVKQYLFNEKSQIDSKIISDILESYYQIWLSGTHASIEQREKILKALFDAGDAASIKLGETLLKKALTTSRLMGRDCQFGAHHRDYGYSFKGEEITQWMTIFTNFACALIETGQAYANGIKRLVAAALPNMIECGCFAVVKNVVTRISKDQPWPEAGVALVNFIKRNKERITPEFRKKLDLLTTQLIPKTLEEEIEIYALFERWSTFDIGDEDYDAALRRQKAETRTYELGIQLGANIPIYKKLLPKLIEPAHNRGNNRLFSLGEGLGKATDYRLAWEAMQEQFSLASSEARDVGLLLGFINELSSTDPALKESILLKMSTNPLFYPEFLRIQIQVDSTNPNLHERLLLAMKLVPESFLQWDISHIAHLCPCYEDEKLYIELLTKLRLFCKPSNDFVVNALYTWMGKYSKISKSASLMREYSLAFLGELSFVEANGQRCGTGIEYHLRELLKICMPYETELDKKCITQFLQRYRKTALSNPYIDWHTDSVLVIGRALPDILLGVLLPDGEDMPFTFPYKFGGEGGNGKYLINQMDIQVVTEWFLKNPEERILKLLKLAQIFAKENDMVIITPLALRLIEHFPGDISILTEWMADRVFPSTSWSMGSLEKIVSSRVSAIEALCQSTNHKIRIWANSALPKAQEIITSAMEMDRRDELRYDRFE